MREVLVLGQAGRGPSPGAGPNRSCRIGAQTNRGSPYVQKAAGTAATESALSGTYGKRQARISCSLTQHLKNVPAAESAHPRHLERVEAACRGSTPLAIDRSMPRLDSHEWKIVNAVLLQGSLRYNRCKRADRACVAVVPDSGSGFPIENLVAPWRSQIAVRAVHSRARVREVVYAVLPCHQHLART